MHALVVALALGACASPGVGTGNDAASAIGDTVEPEGEVASVADDALEEAVIIVEPPGYCEQLLENLEQARPLLEGLDERLAGYTERVEALAAGIDIPDPAPRPAECPDAAGGSLAG